MIFYICTAPVLVLAGCLFVLTFRRRTEGNLPSSRVDLASQLRPFVQSNASAARYMDSSELWLAIQQVGGLRAIYAAGGDIVTEALRRKSVHPDAESLATRILVINIELRLIMPLCLGESHACQYAPFIPRVFAWVVARLYCDLISTLQAMPSPA